MRHIRALEREVGRPMTILADLQGPKIRIGKFDSRVELKAGQAFTLDRDSTPGDATRVELPHPEIFDAVAPGQRLLLDDGKVVLKVVSEGRARIETEVAVAGALSSNKGLNVPDAVVPMAALTDKDRRDLDFALDNNVDWVALRFVQRPADVAEAPRLIAGRATLLAQIEKPTALGGRGELLAITDAGLV